MWLIFLSISILLSSVVSIIQKVNLRDKNIDSTAYAIFYQILVGVIIIVYTAFLGFNFSNFIENWPFLIIMVLLYSFTNIIVFHVLQKIDVSDFTIVYQINSLFVVLFSWIFLSENLYGVQWIGFILVFLGIILSLYDHKIIIHSAHMLVVVAAAVAALAFINDALVVRHVDVPTYLSVSFSAPGIFTLIFYPKALKNLPIIMREKNLLYIVLASSFIAIGAILFFIAYKMINNAALISSLGKFSAVIVVLVGIFFLGEKKRMVQKVVGSVISLAGVLLLL